MASRLQLLGAAILALSASGLANPLARKDTSDCPASCVVTTTITVVSSATYATTPSTITTPYLNSSIITIEPSSVLVTVSAPVFSSAPFEASAQYSETTQLSSSTESLIAIQSVGPVQSSSSPQQSVTPPISVGHCSHNNCLRQFIRHPQVSAFCVTYTATINAQTTNLPTYVSQCHADPTRISSACSCIVTEAIVPISGIVSSVAQQTVTDGGVYTSEIQTSAAPTSTMESSMCATSLVYETYTETTTYLFTLTGSPSMWSNTTSLAIISDIVAASTTT